MRAKATAWRRSAYSGGGGRVGLEFFGEKTPEYFAQEAVRQVLVQLEAEEAPAGEMTVVLGPGWPGILLHEAVGHGLEADFNRKGVSAFSNRIGQQVASPLCTVVDDGSIRNRRGSLNVDDEGTPTASKCSDRKWHPARLSAGQAVEPAASRAPHRQRTARELPAHPACPA